MEDLRTAAEKRYDELKSGSAYTKPSTLLLAVADFVEDDHITLAREADRLLEEDTPISPAEQACLDILLKRDDAKIVDWVLAQLPADPWEAVLDITSDPTNDGRTAPRGPIIDRITDDEDDVCSICGAVEDCDCDDRSDAERARELQPVPPVPAGYPTDKAMIYKSYGETFISIDRRDGELLICDQGTGADNAVILSGARALALYRFFWNDAMIELMEYHRKNATVTAPLGRS